MTRLRNKILGEVLDALYCRDWSIVVEAWKDFNVIPTRSEWIAHNAAPNARSQRLTDSKVWKSWLRFDKAERPFKGDSAVQLSFANDLFLLLDQG